MMLFCRAVVAVVVLMAGGSARAQALQPVRVLLDWGWLPYHAAFFIAKDRGYFRDAGVDVTFEEGRGSNTTAILVGQGGYDMGHLNVTNAVAAMARGVPLRVVALYMHRSPASFVGIAGKVKLDGPESLAGLRIGSTPGGSDGLSLSVFSRMFKIPASSLNVISLDASSKTAALVTGQVDVVSGDSHAYSAIVRSTGKQAVVLQLADYGLPLLGFGFAANETFLREHQRAVAGVLAGYRRGFADMAADVPAACAMIRARVQVAGSQEQCVDYARGYIALATPAGDAGWGRSTPEEWQKLVDTLVGVGEIKQAPAIGAIYTNSALP